MEVTWGRTPEHESPFSAAEIETLLTYPDVDVAWCLKLLLLELVVNRALEIVPAERRTLGLKRGIIHLLAPGVPQPRPLALSLAHVQLFCSGAFASSGDSPRGVPLAKIAYELYDSGLADLQMDLADRGLVAREPYHRLRFFRAYRWVLTETGLAKKAEFETSVRITRQWYVDWRTRSTGGQSSGPKNDAGALLLLIAQPHPTNLREPDGTADSSVPRQEWLEHLDPGVTASESASLPVRGFESAFDIIDTAVNKAVANWNNRHDRSY